VGYEKSIHSAMGDGRLLINGNVFWGEKRTAFLLK
jgi:hypothetical protein